MDYEHDDRRRAADVPGVPDAEGSGLPAGREPIDAGSPFSRSPEVYAVDPNTGSGLGPSEPTASGPADDLFDAMFLSGGFRPPAFAAVDHDLGFPPPQAPDLASAFLAALDAIDDRRFVTPVPEEPPTAPIAPVETAAGGPVYELRPQSQLELESEGTSEPVEEAPAAPVIAEDATRLPWDTGRVPVAGLLTMGEITAKDVKDVDDVEDVEDVEEFASAEEAELIEPIEEAAYFAAGVDGAADADGDDAEAAAVIAAEAEAEAEHVAAAAAQDEDDAEAAAIAAAAAADAEAEALALAIAEAEQAELEAAIAAEAALDEASGESDGASWGSSEAFAGAFEAASDAVPITSAFDTSLDESLDAPLGDDEFDVALDAVSLDAVSLEVGPLDAAAFDAAAFDEVALDASPDAASVEPLDADLAPDDEDFELGPSIGMNPIDAAPMTFDGPDAFAPAAMAVAEPEPEPESDELEDLQDFVVFSLGDMRCVVPIRNVVEVGRIPDAAPVPNAPVWLYGLGNLRGQVLSLIDLRAFFGVGRIKASAGRMVVLRGDSDDITAGVMVDQVHQIVALSPSRFKEAPAGLPLPERSAEFVWGACDYGNYTMIGLDVDGVLGVESLTEETV